MRRIGKLRLSKPWKPWRKRWTGSRRIYRNALPDVFGGRLKQLANPAGNPTAQTVKTTETATTTGITAATPLQQRPSSAATVASYMIAAASRSATPTNAAAPPIRARLWPVDRDGQPAIGTAGRRQTANRHGQAAGQRFQQIVRGWGIDIQHFSQKAVLVLKAPGAKLQQRSVKRQWAAAAQADWLPAIGLPLLLGAVQVTLRLRPVAGVYANTALLALLVGLALWRPRYRAIGIVSSLVPVATMVAISLPPASRFIQLTSYYGVLLVLGVIYRYLIGFAGSETAASRLGRRGYASWLPAMIVGGQLLGLLGYGLLRASYPFAGIATPAVIGALVLFALTEEIVFRGLLQQQAGAVWGRGPAAVLAAGCFAAGTIGIGNGAGLGGSAALLWPLFGLALGGSLSSVYARKPNLLLTLMLNIVCKLSFLGLLSAIS